MFKPLNDSQKFKKGSILWIIFFEPERELFKEINWRTGFLLRDLKAKTPITQPILIDTKDIFPNQSLLCLPLKKDSWSLDSYHHWKNMDKPSCRIFIPLGGSEKKLEISWPSSESYYNLYYYKET